MMDNAPLTSRVPLNESPPFSEPGFYETRQAIIKHMVTTAGSGCLEF